MWLSRAMYLAIFGLAILQSSRGKEIDGSGSGSSDGADEATSGDHEEVKKVVSKMKKFTKGSTESDLSNHIKKENRITSNKFVKKEKRPGSEKKRKHHDSNEYFMKPQTNNMLDVQIQADSRAAPRTNIFSSDENGKKNHDENKKSTLNKQSKGKDKGKATLPFKRFPDVSSDEPFFPISLSKSPAQIVSATTLGPSSPSATTTPDAAVSSSESLPPPAAQPGKAKEEEGGTTEITLTAQPNEQLVNEVKGVEARIGVLESAVTQIKESVEDLKKEVETKKAPTVEPEEPKAPSDLPILPHISEMIIEAIKKPSDEEPKAPEPFIAGGQIEGSPVDTEGLENNPFGIPESGPEAHDLKEVFIPLPPKNSEAENEIEEGSPIPGLPFPVNFMVSKILKKMMKARANREKEGPGEHLTPSPDQDTPPEEHDIGQLETEIAPHFERLFSSEAPELPIPSPGNDEPADKPGAPAIMEIMVSKSSKEPTACNTECLNGGVCSGENTCQCPEPFSGPRCATFSLFRQLKPLRKFILEQENDKAAQEPTIEISKSFSPGQMSFSKQRFNPRGIFGLINGFMKQLTKQRRGMNLNKRSSIPRPRIREYRKRMRL